MSENNSLMRLVVGDIKDELLKSMVSSDFSNNPNVKNGKRVSLFNLLYNEIREKVNEELKREYKFTKGSGWNIASIDKSTSMHKKSKSLDEVLEKAEKKLDKVSDCGVMYENEDIENVSLDDLDDVDLATIRKLEERGVKVIYPNLKYRKPKYKNMESVLKYIESDEGNGGVKLVIMNFND